MNTNVGTSTVLVVDDNPANRELLCMVLEMDYQVVAVASAEAALRVARGLRPDLLLLDIGMPGMDGFTMFEHWQGDACLKDIPVIFVTARNDHEGELHGLQMGAVDYVTKPFVVPILLARVRTQLELRNARKQLEAHNEKLTHDLELAEDIVNRMRRAPAFDARFIRSLMSSVDATNGDMLLSAFTADGRQWVLVGDMSGHGLPAAVSAPLISYIFYEQVSKGQSLAKTLNLINTVMCQQLPTQIYMPCCALEVDRAKNSAWLCNTGLPGCCVIRAAGAEQFSTRTFPLGIVADVDYACEGISVDFSHEDRFYFFSDGMTEITASDDKQFGVEGVLKLLVAYPRNGSFDSVLDKLADYQGSRQFPDDITLVEVSAS